MISDFQVLTHLRVSHLNTDAGSLQMLARRLAALVYDGLLLAGVLFFASLPITILAGGAIHGGAHVFQLYLLTIIYLYSAWQWIHGGQTLGMKAWRLRVIANDGSKLGWLHSLKRFLAAGLSFATFGLGYVWLLFDQDHCAWHDRLSNTRMILMPKMKAGWKS